MRLLIKQRVFALTDTYDVYDEDGNPKYFVKNELLSILHRIHVKDKKGHEIGSIHQKLRLRVERSEMSRRNSHSSGRSIRSIIWAGDVTAISSAGTTGSTVEALWS